jgi:exosortase
MSTLQVNPLRGMPHSPFAGAPPASARQIATSAGVAALGFVWCYWPTLSVMAERWTRDPQYSHGFLVPIFACTYLWSKRDRLARLAWQPDPIGVPLLLAGLALHVLGAVLDIEALDAFSLLPVLLGLVLLVAGRDLARWCLPAIAFLAFMLPLPFFLEISLAHPLRRLATQVSTYALQTLGCPALAEGNVILIGDARLGVAEACSGLGMLMTFFALATALAMVANAPLVDRLLLVVSAAPIAVLANVARITATGLAYHWWGAGSPAGRAILHDLAGWLMMPLALVLLYLEMRFLSRVFFEEPESRPLPLALTPRLEKNR